MTSPAPEPLRPQTGDALIVTEVQNDFLPGGAVPVVRAESVVAPLRRCAVAFAGLHLPVFAVRDWHPPLHCSFHSRGGKWPPHCIAESYGAEFAHELLLPRSALIVSKATHPAREAHSAFNDTELEERLRNLGVRRLFVGGLATELCVLETVMDAIRARFEVYLLTDAIRPVDARPGDGLRALQKMAELGARPCRSIELVG